MVRGLVLAIVAMSTLPLSSDQDSAATCDQGALTYSLGKYPLHRMSPMESLGAYGAVFHGEVTVPLKECSLGYCAGITVSNQFKGMNNRKTVLVRVPKDNTECAPPVFRDKGQRWVIFGELKYSNGGLPYVDIKPDSPTFVSQVTPSFTRMESEYAVLRERLDFAIDRKRKGM